MAGELSNSEWSELEALFEHVVEVPPEQRASWIDLNCSNPRIKGVLTGMLDADAQAESAPHTIGSVTAVLGDWLHSESSPADINQLIGPYRLEREVGQGATSRVFLATREGMGGRLALKLLRYDPFLGEEVRQRFAFEHRLLARLEHRHIARLLDAGISAEGVAYQAMEYVEGEPITRYCLTRKLAVEGRLELFLQACDAVGHAHQHGVIHRDLKPANVLVNQRGSVKLLDFGIGKLMEDEEGKPQTRTSITLMTPQYASPEQLLGGDATTLSDIYSLGIILYEMITGHRPFTQAEQNQRDLERAVATTVPSNPSTCVPGALAREVRGDLDSIVLRALRREPGQRYADVNALANDIRKMLKGEPVEARGGTRIYRARKFLWRNRLPLAAAGLAVVLGMGYLWRETTLRREAETALATSEQVTSFLISLFTEADPSQARGETLTALEILDAGADRIETSLTDQPLVQNQLMQTIGAVYGELGQYEQSGRLLNKALEQAMQLYGSGDERTARLQARLARLYILAGDHYQESDRLGEQALVTMRDIHGDQSLEVAAQLDDLAFGWVKTGRHRQQAEVYLLEALDIQRRLLEPNHPQIASTIYHLGWAANNLGDRERSRSLYEQSLAIRRTAYGDTHPSLAWNTNNLGHLEISLGNAQAGKSYCEEALAINRRLFPGLHNEQGFNLRCIAMAERLLGNLQAAREAAEESVNVLEATLPGQSAELARTYTILARIHADEGRRDAALTSQQQAIDIYRAMGSGFRESLARSRDTYEQYLATDSIPATSD